MNGYADLLQPELVGKIASADPASSSSAFCQLTNMLLAMGGYEDDYGAPAPAARAPRGGNTGGQRQAPRRPAPQQRDDDLGPAFPSEASNMDEVPF